MAANEPVAMPTNSIPHDTLQPKRSRFWFRRMLGMPEPVPPRSVIRRELLAPSKGGGFDFSISIGLIWTVPEGKRRRSLRRAMEYHEAALWEDIETTVCLVARCYPPDQALQVEEVLSDKLRCSAQEWRPTGFKRGDAKWKAWVRVEPHEDVKDLQQRFWLERLEQAAAMHFSRSQVAQLRKLTSQWRLYLGDLNIDDPSLDKKPAPYLAQYLARLAVEPRETSTTMKELAKVLENYGTKLRQVVENAVEQTQKVNTYEFLTTYESALLLLMKHIGAQPVELGKDVGYGGAMTDPASDGVG